MSHLCSVILSLFYTSLNKVFATRREKNSFNSFSHFIIQNTDLMIYFSALFAHKRIEYIYLFTFFFVQSQYSECNWRAHFDLYGMIHSQSINFFVHHSLHRRYVYRIGEVYTTKHVIILLLFVLSIR